MYRCYRDEIESGRHAILETLLADERVIKDPPPAVLVKELSEIHIKLSVFPFVRREDFFSSRSDLFEAIKSTLERTITLPSPQLGARVYQEQDA